MIGALGFNVVLSSYYVLVIVKNYREWHFQSLRKWFLVVPIVIAVGMACAGIPFYNYVLIYCHIPPYPVAPDQTQIALFVLVPIAFAWFVCSVNMARIFWVVRKQSITAERWRLAGRGRSSITVFEAPMHGSSQTPPSYVDRSSSNDTMAFGGGIHERSLSREKSSRRSVIQRIHDQITRDERLNLCIVLWFGKQRFTWHPFFDVAVLFCGHSGRHQ